MCADGGKLAIDPVGSLCCVHSILAVSLWPFWQPQNSGRSSRACEYWLRDSTRAIQG